MVSRRFALGYLLKQLPSRVRIVIVIPVINDFFFKKTVRTMLPEMRLKTIMNAARNFRRRENNFLYEMISYVLVYVKPFGAHVCDRLA